ncbi:MAG: hypothetical protein AAF250_06695 [Pseudomonadota bacterium]
METPPEHKMTGIRLGFPRIRCPHQSRRSSFSYIAIRCHSRRTMMEALTFSLQIAFPVGEVSTSLFRSKLMNYQAKSTKSEGDTLSIVSTSLLHRHPSFDSATAREHGDVQGAG